MMPASKHGDPQMGVDIHLCVVPPSPSPVPLPTPHISVVFDPFDYAPIIGATVTVCGMKRATAGTNGMAVHIPPGFPFAPKLPDKDDELFMGSATVVADGDPFSFIAVPVLGCQVAGMISPPRLKKKGPKKLMLLPTTFNLAIPTNVFVGGPPTISLLGLAFKGLFAGLGRFAKSGLFKRFRQKLFGNLKPGLLKCLILRAEPVNILTGEVSVDQEDFTLPGRIPIEWLRSYTSGSDHEGLCGYGWETPADTRLEIDPIDGIVCMRHPAVGPLFFARLPVAVGDEAAELEMVDGALLSDRDDEYRVRTKEDRIYHFPKTLARVNQRGGAEYPIGRIADLCGNWLDFDRRGGVLIGIDESAGRRITVTVKHGRIREVALMHPGADVYHSFVRYEYDEAEDLVAVIDALDHPYRFAYDEHHLVRHTDRNGLSFYYEYDKTGEDWRVVHSWGDGGLYNYKFEYIDALKERRVMDSLGHVSVVKLDERGLPICEIDPLGGRTVYEYDDAGRTTAVVDAGERRTEYTYDQRGNLLTLTRPDGCRIASEFDHHGRITRVTDATGAIWRQRWDTRGLLVQQVSPLGHSSRYEYSASGQLIAFINPRAVETRLAFDAFGNLSELTDAIGHKTSFAFDVLGNLVSSRDPLGRATAYEYDVKGRLTAAALPSGTTISCRYSPGDDLVEYIDERAGRFRFEYRGLGEISSRILPNGHTIEYLHDSEERLIGVKNERGEVYRFTRDVLGRVVEEIDYWGQVSRYEYDASGFVRSAIDPLNRQIHYVTDPLGRITKKLPSDGGEESFVYDANGNLLQAANEHAAIIRQFDAEGRLLTETQGEGFAVENAYDECGNRVRRATTLGNVMNYEFDALDRSVLLTINGGEPIRIVRDAGGQVTEEFLTADLSRRYGYNDDGLCTTKVVAGPHGRRFSTHYDYDRAGNMVRRRDSQYAEDRYTYDPLDRIREHIDPRGKVNRYFVDPSGDRLQTSVKEESTSTVAIAGEWRREAMFEGKRYQFDRAGNLVMQVEAGREVQLEWNANQRLVETRSNGTRISYWYDPLGRRVFKQTDDSRTSFFWDGDVLVGEAVVRVAGSSNEQPSLSELTREFLYYPDSFEPIARVDSQPGHRQTLFFHNDPNGCPTRVTDEYGNVKWAAGYGAFGEVSALYVNDVNVRHRLQGQYHDDETGFTYNRYRYYAGEIGHCLSLDPLRQMAGPNLYELSPNIFRWVDPLGLNCTPGKHFKDHFIRHKHLLEAKLGKHYPKWKAGGGTEFLKDIDKMVADGRLRHVGQGTLKKGEPPVNIFRGDGLTLVTKPGGEFVTLLESGKGMDTAIQMLPGQLSLPGIWP